MEERNSTFLRYLRRVWRLWGDMSLLSCSHLLVFKIRLHQNWDTIRKYVRQAHRRQEDLQMTSWLCLISLLRLAWSLFGVCAGSVMIELYVCTLMRMWEKVQRETRLEAAAKLPRPWPSFRKLGGREFPFLCWVTVFCHLKSIPLKKSRYHAYERMSTESFFAENSGGEDSLVNKHF